MKAAMSLNTSEWLKSSDPVMPVGSSLASDVLSTVGTALSKGVCGIPDMKRSGFYDVEISGRWFYIHIPDHLSRVYVVAAYCGPRLDTGMALLTEEGSRIAMWDPTSREGGWFPSRNISALEPHLRASRAFPS
jgi:hypothetical protein